MVPASMPFWHDLAFDVNSTPVVPILAGFIAYSIADRPGIAPGMIGGMLASSIGAGFIAGYATDWFSKMIKLPRNNEISDYRLLRRRVLQGSPKTSV